MPITTPKLDVARESISSTPTFIDSALSFGKLNSFQIQSREGGISDEPFAIANMDDLEDDHNDFNAEIRPGQMNESGFGTPSLQASPINQIPSMANFSGGMLSLDSLGGLTAPPINNF